MGGGRGEGPGGGLYMGGIPPGEEVREGDSEGGGEEGREAEERGREGERKGGRTYIPCPEVGGGMEGGG